MPDLLLAYRPFLDPLPVHELWWTLLLPLAFFISFSYKAVRLPDHDLAPARFLRHVAVMTAQIVLAMVALGAGIYLFTEVLLPIYS
ncbi:MAG: hypothetical protein AB7G17_10270 [Phycisphaerales bacterium]